MPNIGYIHKYAVANLLTFGLRHIQSGKKTGTNVMETKIVEPFIQYSGDPMCERVAEWHMQIIHSASNSGEEGLAWRHLHL